MADPARRVIVYLRDDSAQCRAVRRFLEDAGIPYQSKDTAQAAVRNEMFQRYGVLVVPIIVIGGRAFFGYDANRDEIRAALGIS